MYSAHSWNRNSAVSILRISDLIAAGYGSRTTIWRAVKDGRLPPPRDILGRPGWLESEILSVVKSSPQSDLTEAGSDG